MQVLKILRFVPTGNKSSRVSSFLLSDHPKPLNWISLSAKEGDLSETTFPCRSCFGPQLDCLDVRAVQEHHEEWSFENCPIRWLFLIWLTFLSDLIYLYTTKQTCMRHVFYRPILTTGRFSVSSFRICRELWVGVYRSVVIKSLNQVNKPWPNKEAWYLLAFSRFRQAETSICEKKNVTMK